MFADVPNHKAGPDGAADLSAKTIIPKRLRDWSGTHLRGCKSMTEVSETKQHVDAFHCQDLHFVETMFSPGSTSTVYAIPVFQEFNMLFVSNTSVIDLLPDLY